MTDLASILKKPEKSQGDTQQGLRTLAQIIRFPSPTGKTELRLLNEQLSSNFQFLQRKLSSSPAHIRNAVNIDSSIKHGNPVFSGTRIPVYQIIEELADGTRLEELPEGYPSLTLEQIQTGLDFVASILRIYDD